MQGCGNTVPVVAAIFCEIPSNNCQRGVRWQRVSVGMAERWKLDKLVWNDSRRRVHQQYVWWRIHSRAHGYYPPVPIMELWIN